MSKHRVAGPASADALAAPLLATLGLAPDAGPEEVEAVRDQLEEFLRTAPEELAPWARQQVAAADAAYLALTGRPAGAAEPAAGPAPRPAAPARTAPSTSSTEDFDVADYADDESPAGASSPTRPTPAAKPTRPSPAATRQRPTRPARPAAAAPRRPQRALRFAALVAAGALVVVLVQQLGAPPAQTPAPGSAGTTSTSRPTTTPVDPAKVAGFTAALAANPADLGALDGLADLYFAAADYRTSADYRRRMVEIQPTKTDTRLELGVALYNANDLAGAEAQWQEVLRIDPQSAEAYYDLGFLYLSKTPPEMDRTEQAWTKVIELDPSSQMAATVKGHLERMKQGHGGTLTPPTSTATATGAS